MIKDVARETVQSTAMYYDKLNVHMWIATGLLSLTAGKYLLVVLLYVRFIRFASAEPAFYRS